MVTTRRSSRRKPRTSTRPRDVLQDIARRAGCHLSSIGDFEALSGIDVQSQTERSALWMQFQHLFAGDSQTLIDAVMDHCATAVLDRLQRSELSLLSSWPAGVR